MTIKKETMPEGELVWADDGQRDDSLKKQFSTKAVRLLEYSNCETLEKFHHAIENDMFKFAYNKMKFGESTLNEIVSYVTSYTAKRYTESVIEHSLEITSEVIEKARSVAIDRQKAHIIKLEAKIDILESTVEAKDWTIQYWSDMDKKKSWVMYCLIAILFIYIGCYYYFG